MSNMVRMISGSVRPSVVHVVHDGRQARAEDVGKDCGYRFGGCRRDYVPDVLSG